MNNEHSAGHGFPWISYRGRHSGGGKAPRNVTNKDLSRKDIFGGGLPVPGKNNFFQCSQIQFIGRVQGEFIDKENFFGNFVGGKFLVAV